MTIGALRTPLLTAFYTLLGVGVAWLWFRQPTGSRLTAGIIAVVVIAGLAVLAYGSRELADSKVTTKPRLAVRLYDLQAAIIGLTAAATTGLVTVATISLSGLSDDDPDKTLIASVSAALSALISGVFVSVKDSDEALGKYVAKVFRSSFYQRYGKSAEQLAEEEQAGHVALPYDSPPVNAVHNLDADWSRDGRREIADVIEKYLKWRAKQPKSELPPWNPDWGSPPDEGDA